MEDREEEEDEEEEDDEEEEEEAECSAPQCKKPIADQISWVQCDLCQEWFHCTCVGLTKEYAEKIDKYNCKKCKIQSGREQPETVRSSSTGASGTGATIKTRTVQTTKGPAMSSGVRQNLMKGLMKNPQLAAQLLSTHLPQI